MDVLVIGGGGREHAICAALRRSRRVDKLYCMPGNAGIAQIAECVPIAAADVDGAVRWAESNDIGFVVVAPDDPLALGMVDAMEAAGIRAFGPNARAAMIESSKSFAKRLMKKHGIPTASYAEFTDADKAARYIREQGAPIVVKADGLALGKGVVVAQSVEEAETAAVAMLQEGKFGRAGARIVIEEYMTGPEVTVLAFTDGRTVVAMPSAQDHKRAYDGDRGPNTGGMGAFVPSPLYTPEISGFCGKYIILPTIVALAMEGRPFKGVLYCGLMLTPEGPRVVEYNARFGDPEAQALLPLLETDIMDVFEAVVDEKLNETAIKWKKSASCCVVMASGGYPGAYETGKPITGLELVPEDITVFHAGTQTRDGAVVTSGGRVLGVTALADDLAAAAARAYEGVGLIGFEGAHYRSDIGRSGAADGEGAKAAT
jgi:phosphoribosylamine--glycine ligase